MEKLKNLDKENNVIEKKKRVRLVHQLLTKKILYIKEEYYPIFKIRRGNYQKD